MTAGGLRIEGKLVRCYFRATGRGESLLRIGVGIQDRSVAAVRRNRGRRLLRAAVDKEHDRLVEGLRARACSLEVLFTLRRGADPAILAFDAIHADLAQLCTTLLIRIPRPRQAL